MLESIELLPIADAREDVRRHVLRMRGARARSWRSSRAAFESFLGDRRIVVEMDQIVRDAGMLRLALEDRLQDRRAFELVGVGLVGRRGRRVERERVVDLRLVVFRIALRQLLHGLGIGLHARAVVDLVVIGVHDARARRCSRARAASWRRRLSLGDRGSALGEILRGRRDVRVPQQAQRNAPIGDAAFGIGLQDILEDLLRCAVPERMLVQHRAVEVLLRLRFARRLEMHLAEFAVVRLSEAPGGQAKVPRRRSGNGERCSR